VLKKIGIIGKGVVFDTGGYNIKLHNMEYMKKDCAGGAAVLGAAYTISLLQPKNIEIHFIVPACDNMISARAMAPGDILVASNGTTIEITNTDGEGRLLLADALVYADKEIQCETIIELSTLTGARVVGLGHKYGGVFTNNDKLANELLHISKNVDNEKLWRLPIINEYKVYLTSNTNADIKNVANTISYGGAITAALFLQEFITSTIPFAHIDMSGPSWNYIQSDTENVGATGYGVKLLTEWILYNNRNKSTNQQTIINLTKTHM
jgi:leucyl aminopeptidase